MYKELFYINMKLPSLNEFIKANRTNVHVGNSFKQDIEEAIGWQIKQAVSVGNLTPKTEPVDILIDFYELTRRRDVDNIQSSTKFILDALQIQGILKNDGRKYVNQIYHRVYDAPKEYKHDFCIVTLYPAGSLTLHEG